MLKKLIFLLIFYFIGLACYSQPNTFLKIYSTYPPYEIGKSVVQTSGGGYLIIASGGITSNTLIIKTDSAGDVLLTKSYCGIYAFGLTNTIDSNYIYISTSVLACANSSDYRPIKINNNADTLWAENISAPGIQASNTLRSLQDGTFVIGGVQSGNYAFCKIDSTGALIWNYGVPMSEVQSIIQDSENNFVLCGYLDGFLNSWVVMKTDSTGANVLWVKYYGTTGGFGQEKFYDLVQLPDSNYLVGGLAPQFLMKINKNSGDSIWRNTTLSVIKSIDLTANGGYIAAGSNKLYLINDTGGIVWTKSYLTSSLLDFTWVRSTVDGGFIVTGSGACGTNACPMLLKTDSLGNFTTGIENLNIQVLNYSLYPNPVTTQSRLEFGNAKRENYEFVLYDITGREIETAVTNGDGITIKKHNKPAGLYLFSLRNENTGERMNGKIIMQ